MVLGEGRQTSIRVYARIRPPLGGEQLAVRWQQNEERDTVEIQQRSYEKFSYAFDRVFGTDATQEEVFTRICEPLLEDVLLGHQCTLFCYGQTGTGKTFTLSNLGAQDPSSRGVIPRALEWLHERAQADDRITLQYVQVYKETLQDLLSASPNRSVSIRQDEYGCVYLHDVHTEPSPTLTHSLHTVERGEEHRVVGLTKMNATSSRSHTCLMVMMTRSVEEEGSDPYLVRGKLTLVDLAGSERVSKTGSEGERLEEAKGINLSLSALGNVISHLISETSTYVPYRDSVLTRLLQDSLGGVGKTSVVVTLGPDLTHASESICSCVFGQRAMKVKNVAKIRREEDWKSKAVRLEKELAEAQRDNARLRARNSSAVRTQATVRAEESTSSIDEADMQRVIRENFEYRSRNDVLSRKVEELQMEVSQLREHVPSPPRTAPQGHTETAGVLQADKELKEKLALSQAAIAELTAKLSKISDEKLEADRRAERAAASIEVLEKNLKAANAQVAVLERGGKEKQAYIIDLERCLEKLEHEYQAHVTQSEGTIADLKRTLEDMARDDAPSSAPPNSPPPSGTPPASPLPESPAFDDPASPGPPPDDDSDGPPPSPVSSGPSSPPPSSAPSSPMSPARQALQSVRAQRENQKVLQELTEQHAAELSELRSALEAQRCYTDELLGKLEAAEAGEAKARSALERVEAEWKEKELSWAKERGASSAELEAMHAVADKLANGAAIANARRAEAEDSEARCRAKLQNLEQKIARLKLDNEERVQVAFGTSTRSLPNAQQEELQGLREKAEAMEKERGAWVRERDHLLRHVESITRKLTEVQLKKEETEARLTSVLQEQLLS
eukprot:Sspe_Gene.13517::Locus_4622_Transcript_4_5_Confidence_0.250_Length_2892::g.13517::m.13517